MPDWLRLVRKRLPDLALDPAEREEVHAELAAHLEESYEVFRNEGLAEHEAIHRTFARAGDWKELRQGIYSARSGKDTMTNRVKQLWLPGLLTFTLSMVLLELAQKFGPRPFILDLDKGTPVLMLYTSWLLILPLAGALGAYLSKRSGGSTRMVLLSSIFPVLPFAVVFMIAIPGGLVTSQALAHHIVAAAFFTMTIGWVVAPGAALLAGGLLAQFFLSRGLRSNGIASH